MQEATKEVRVSIDHPQEDERVTTPSYSFRIKAPLNAEHVDVSIDGSAWARCRYASGYWWHDWSGYGPGPHEAVARIRPFDSRGFILRTRRFTVELASAPEERPVRRAATLHTTIVPNSPGALAKVLAALAEEKLQVSCLLAVNVGDAAVIHFIAGPGELARPELAERLLRAGIKTIAREVLALSLAKSPCQLGSLAKTLADGNIGVRCLFGAASSDALRVIVAVDRVEAALGYLASAKL